MKKILTFLVMLLMTGSMLMAQNPTPVVQDNPAMPKLNYQAVLRDSLNNKLLPNKSGQVKFELVSADVTEAVYETDFESNMNGLVQVFIAPNPELKWNGKTLRATFTFDGGEKQVVINTPVTTVPYALQAANVKLTTQMMVDYLDVNNTNGSDAHRVAQALGENFSVKTAARDSVVNYIKHNFPIAKEIAYDYLHKVTVADVNEAYEQGRSVDQSVKDTTYQLVKKYIKDHRTLMVEIAEFLIQDATQQEAEEIFTALRNSAAGPVLLEKFYAYFDHYLRVHGLICPDNSQDLCAYAATVSANIACPTLTSAEGLIHGNVCDFVIKVDNPGEIDLTNQKVIIEFTVNLQGAEQPKVAQASYNNSTHQFELKYTLQPGESAFVADFTATLSLPGNCNSSKTGVYIQY